MFSAVLLQIQLSDHRSLFRNYPNTFSTDEAIKVMSSLQFVHLRRQPDPSNPKVQIATRTTTTFSMDMTTAKNMIHYFLMARLIQNATDPNQWTTMREKGFWSPTPKGRYVIQEFAAYTQVEINAILRSLPSSPKIINIERIVDYDDKITFARDNMTLVFKSMLNSLSLDPIVWDEVGGIERKNLYQYQHTFLAQHAVEWLMDRVTVTCTDEAEMIAAEFVLFGWIALVLDRSDKSLNTKDEGITFKTGRNTVYYVTERGYIAASWKLPKDETIHTASNVSLHSQTSAGSNSIRSTSLSNKTIKPSEDTVEKEPSEIDEKECHNENQEITPKPPRPPSMTFTDSSMSHNSSTSVKDSSQYTRLYHILETPLLRMHFREFLKANYCTENILFWVDYDRLLRNYKSEMSPLEQLSRCYNIYESYLSPKAVSDVNIDHTLRQDITQYIQSTFIVCRQPNTAMTFIVPDLIQHKQDRLLLLPPQATLKNRVFTIQGGYSPERCLLKMIGLLGKVNDHVCKMMAEDSVPKFVKTHRYKELVSPKYQEPTGVEMDLLGALQRVSVEDQRHEIP
ncbi:hypothetical protein BY458DRAFT_533581 [Sporodiniella umbellata]|nr:hypothetical protein BY458DRAFT_533581 [Sporodiniella umbellata]